MPIQASPIKDRSSVILPARFADVDARSRNMELKAVKTRIAQFLAERSMNCKS